MLVETDLTCTKFSILMGFPFILFDGWWFSRVTENVGSCSKGHWNMWKKSYQKNEYQPRPPNEPSNECSTFIRYLNPSKGKLGDDNSKICFFSPGNLGGNSNLTSIFFRWVESNHQPDKVHSWKFYTRWKMKSRSFWGGGIDLICSLAIFLVLFLGSVSNFPLGWWFGIRIGIPLTDTIPFIFGDPIGIQSNPNHQAKPLAEGCFKEWGDFLSVFLWYLRVAKKQKLLQVTPKWWLSSFRFWNYWWFRSYFLMFTLKIGKDSHKVDPLPVITGFITPITRVIRTVSHL